MRAAEREGIAPQVRNFVRQAERARGREQGRGVEKDEGWSDKSGARWMPKSVPGASALRQAGRPSPGLLAALTPSSSDWLLGCQSL